MSTIEIHPSELAYAFSYARTTNILGWGQDPFLPSGEKDGDPKNWLSDGEARLLEAQRLTGDPETGLNFTDEITSAIMALIDPTLVLQAERKEGDGLRRFTVHAKGGDYFGMSRRSDGTFSMTRYADLTAAAAACASFVGATLSPVKSEVRIDTKQKLLSRLHQYAAEGRPEPVSAALVKMGASAPDAASATSALASPKSAGMLSVLYCAQNVAQDAEAFTVMTNSDDDTWVLFAPASPDGPMVLERSSVAALTARVCVGIAARFSSGD